MILRYFQSKTTRRNAQLIGEHFDRDYYLKANPDVAEATIDPVKHYMMYGWREGRNPRPDFSTSDYLAANPTLLERGINPFLHYLTISAATANTVQAGEAHDDPVQDTPDEAESRVAAAIHDHFDAGFYAASYPSAAASGLDPVTHYLRIGWKQGLDPTPDFSTSYYLQAHPDIVAAGVNPFWHYVVSGQFEGRLTAQPGGYKALALKKLQPLEKEVQSWIEHSAPPPEAVTLDQVQAAVHAAIATSKKLVVSFGHDNFVKISGGVQLCIQREAEAAQQCGFTYLNIRPAQPLPRLAKASDADEHLVCPILDGTELGTMPFSDLITLAGAFESWGLQTDFVVHSLLGHRPEMIADMISAAGENRCWFWLHDFFSICPSYVLQRNDVAFCGAPATNSMACSICRYGEERREHRERIKAFFSRLSVNVLAPSAPARDFWLERADLPCASIATRPHVDLTIRKKRKAETRIRSDVVRIAYMGTPMAHKGWQVFQNLCRRYGNSGRLQFYYFGNHDVDTTARKINVHVTKETPLAMVQALAEHDIDIVLHWASWPETFSFTTYEAVSGGTFVITNRQSGNVAATVSKLKRGAVLESENDLEELMKGDGIMMLAASRRSECDRSTVTYSLGSMTVPSLERENA